MNFESVKHLCKVWAHTVCCTPIPSPLFSYREPAGRNLLLHATNAAWEKYHCWEVADYVFDSDLEYWECFEAIWKAFYANPDLLETSEKDYLLGLDWELFNKERIQVEANHLRKRISTYLKELKEHN